MTIAVQPGTSATPTPQPGATPTTEVTGEVTPVVDPSAAPGVTPGAEAAPAASPEAAPAPGAEPKVLTIPSSSMKRIKDEERTRGRADYAAELDAQAQAAGFANHAEMIKAAQLAKQQPAPAPAAAAADEAKKTADDAAAAEERKQNEERNKRHLEEKKKHNVKTSRHRRELDRIRAERDQAEVRGEIKLAAQAAGVTDLDYAVSVFERAIKGMSDEQLATFDEKKFFSETMRASHPHLYVPQDRPVDTGPGSQAPTPSKAPAAPAPNGGPAAVDATKLSPTDFSALLKKRGLGNPAAGGTLA